VDTENPVVKLCVDGIRAEEEGRPDDARDLFTKAWDAHTNDYEACIAAHYLARHQPTPQDELRWNQEAFDRATAVGDERVAGFWASLCLNLGKSYEDIGDRDKAVSHYTQADTHLSNIPPSPYRNMLERGINAAKQRTGL